MKPMPATVLSGECPPYSMTAVGGKLDNLIPTKQAAPIRVRASIFWPMHGPRVAREQTLGPDSFKGTGGHQNCLKLAKCFCPLIDWKRVGNMNTPGGKICPSEARTLRISLDQMNCPDKPSMRGPRRTFIGHKVCRMRSISGHESGGLVLLVALANVARATTTNITASGDPCASLQPFSTGESLLPSSSFNVQLKSSRAK